MHDNHNYMMWGVIPITFSAQGTWRVAVTSPLLRGLLEQVAHGLLRLNRRIERWSDERIEMHVPLTPIEQSFVYRIAQGLKPSDHDVRPV